MSRAAKMLWRGNSPAAVASRQRGQLQPGGNMAETVTSDQLAAAARGLEKDQFTRAELADKLGVQVSDIKQAVKEARQEGRIDWTGENEEGKGLFRLIGE
jgi:hypothetical protein